MSRELTQNLGNSVIDLQVFSDKLFNQKLEEKQERLKAINSKLDKLKAYAITLDQTLDTIHSGSAAERKEMLKKLPELASQMTEFWDELHGAFPEFLSGACPLSIQVDMKTLKETQIRLEGFERALTQSIPEITTTLQHECNEYQVLSLLIKETLSLYIQCIRHIINNKL